MTIARWRSSCSSISIPARIPCAAPIAQALNVSKPVVTRALNRLGALGYLRRQRDDSDKRNIFIARLPAGQSFLKSSGNSLAKATQDRTSQPTRRAFALTGPSITLDPGRMRCAATPRRRSPCGTSVCAALCGAAEGQGAARHIAVLGSQSQRARWPSCRRAPPSRCSNWPAATPGGLRSAPIWSAMSTGPP